MNWTQRVFCGFAALLVSFNLLCQEQAPADASSTAAVDVLPKEMKGMWNMNSPFYSGRSAACDWSVKIERQDPGGAIAGKLSFCGNYCNAVDAPMQGTYRDGKLVMNAHRGTQCHNRPFELMKGKNHRFERVFPDGATYYLD